MHSAAKLSTALCTLWTMEGVKAVGARLYPQSQHDLIFWKLVLEHAAAVAAAEFDPPARTAFEVSLSAEHADWHC